MIDYRTAIEDVQALPEEAFRLIIAQLTSVNCHTEARVLRAKRTGSGPIVADAMRQYWLHQRLCYKREEDTLEDQCIDQAIKKLERAHV